MVCGAERLYLALWCVVEIAEHRLYIAGRVEIL